MYKLFDFKCNKCNAVFEELVEDNEIPVCPECHSKNCKKLISPTHFTIIEYGLPKKVFEQQEYRRKRKWEKKK